MSTIYRKGLWATRGTSKVRHRVDYDAGDWVSACSKVRGGTRFSREELVFEDRLIETRPCKSCRDRLAHEVQWLDEQLEEIVNDLEEWS